MAAVVLVHGAFHGPWCWDLVVERLDAIGIEAVVPELPFTGIVDDAAAARRAIDEAAAFGPVVVCGHSYGGRVISRAASGHPAVRHLMYLAAVQSDDIYEDGPGRQWKASQDRENPLSAMRLDQAGMLTFDPAAAGWFFFHDCDPAVAATSVAKLRSMSVGPTDPVPAVAEVVPAAWRATTSTYVVCTDDRCIPVTSQRAMAASANAVRELPTSHSPMLSRPELVVDLLHDIVE